MIIGQLFIFTAVIGLITTVANFIGASIYDIRAARQRQHFSRHPYASQYRQRPLVAVVINTSNDEKVIGQCLGGLTAGSYRKLEILVIDHGSTDSTRAIIQQFQAAHPKRPVRLVGRRTAMASGAVIAANVKKYTHAELVLQLSAGSLLDKQAITNLVLRYNMEPSLGVARLNRRVLSAFSTVGLFQQYREMLGVGSKKLASLLNADYEHAIDVIYRREIFLSLHKPAKRPWRTAYASDAVVRYRPNSLFYGLMRLQYQAQAEDFRSFWRQRRLSAWLRLSLALCNGLITLLLPIVVSYFIYMAIALREPAFFVLSLIITAGLVLFAIWGDEQLKTLQKVAYSLLIPVTYGLFYVLSVVKVLAMLRGLVAPKKLLARS